MLELEGKTAVITGGSSGIGRGIALAFATAGASVVVNYKNNRKGAESVVAEIDATGGRGVAIEADISSQQGIESLLKESSACLGGIDTWVNNAGADILTGTNTNDSDENKLQRLIAVDLMGTIGCSWAVLPHMQKRGKGLIINMSWDLAIHGFPGRNPQMFAAVKAGVLGFSKSLALSCAPEVRVNVIAPGWIQTAFADEDMDPSYYQSRISEIPLGRFGKPEDIASAALYLASDRASYITGQVININGGLV